MRLACAAVVILALPGLAAAQSNAPLPRVTPALPSIGLPLPRITPALPSIGLPAAAAAGRSHVPAAPDVHHGRRGAGRRRGGGAGGVFIVPYLWNFGYAPASAVPEYRGHAARSAVVERGPGTLRLDVEPAALVQVFVDGFFVGTPSDFRGDLELEAGTHRVELRAPGYHTLSLDVQIAPGRIATYRRALDPVGGAAPPDTPAAVAPAPDVPAAPVAPRTIYMIPGCYLGNVPPQEASLPATCDASRVTTFEP